MGRAFQAYAPLRLASAITYDIILLVIACFYFAQVAGRKRFHVDVVKLFLGTLFVGTMLYHLCPAAGPIYTFGSAFPQHEPPVSSQMILLTQGPRNAMPSLHLACALLVWWNSRLWGNWGRVLAGAFLLLTTFATLGLGEHYLIDLVVAVPFSVAVSAACTGSVPMQSMERRLALAGGGLLTLVWLLLFRSAVKWAPGFSIVSWLLVLGTLGISIVLHHRLSKVAAS